MLRFLAGFLGNRARQLVAQKGLFGKTLHATVPGLLFFVIALFAASLLSYLCHWAYDNGASLGIGMAATLLALLVSIILGTAITFINRSSIQQTYAVRLGRTYLGATNPERRRDRIWGQDVTEVMPGDDLALRVYTPHERGGPLHLINVMLNHSTDDFSERTLRDRRGESMAVSPFGFSFGKVYHALWGSTEGQVVPVNVPAAEPHPLGNQPTAHTAEPTLQTWVAISGAAISPGRGAETNVGLSLLLGLANLRTGYWWDSNRPRNRPRGYRHFTWLTKLRWTFARFFLPQDLLLNEFLGRFGGPWVRYWYLSDGGFFENLGVYELLRRRVPYILCCDAGEDSEYDFVDLANLIRKARIDFAADIRFLTAEEIQNSEHIPGQVKPLLGPLEGLKPAGQGSHSQRHAALALIRYGDDPTPRSALLYLKSSLTGDEDPDILSYALTHPEFPHDSTADQFFTEPQWESYRRLGEHIGGPLFARGPSGGLWLADLLQGTTK
ncbi:MAG: threonine/serine exporter family protein [Planctomycetota bacterium]|nr:MAG: threonine/serine exporter family protein [Planctomycetota bacterium]